MAETIDDAIRGRRTHKSYGREPVARAMLEELLELARWAPNHHLTQPWRFRVLGPAALARLKEAGGEKEAAKLERAPTLVAASCVLTGDPVQDEEDLASVASAVYAILLGAHARGLAAYWRTPGLLRSPEGRGALGIPEEEQVVALIHLGPKVNDPPAREHERAPVDQFVEFLD